MRISILTLFPKFYESFINSPIIGRTIDRGLLEIDIVNIREFTKDKNGRVDDRPIGGGAGLIMKIEPLLSALNSVRTEDSHVVLLSPTGVQYKQEHAKRLKSFNHLILICGHFEGVDYRFESYVDEVISIGDYVLTGGELASMVLTDSVIRLIPGAISDESIVDESFTDKDLLEYPQYTFPIEFEGKRIPDILLTGNHQAVDYYHKKSAIIRTMKDRPDLLLNKKWSRKEEKMLEEIKNNTMSKLELEAIRKGSKFIGKNNEH